MSTGTVVGARTGSEPPSLRRPLIELTGAEKAYRMGNVDYRAWKIWIALAGTVVLALLVLRSLEALSPQARQRRSARRARSSRSG